MTTPHQAADPAGEACPADDATVIRLSRDEPEQFAARSTVTRCCWWRGAS